jgi:hypothetical protein
MDNYFSNNLGKGISLKILCSHYFEGKCIGDLEEGYFCISKEGSKLCKGPYLLEDKISSLIEEKRIY